MLPIRGNEIGFEPRPVPAMPHRPGRPLSSLELLKVGLSNTLAACDEQLFDELIVERHFVWGPTFVISDPIGVKRVLQDNVDNYPRISPIRRIFAFGSGTGMLSAEGEVWRRHRRMLNPTLDYRNVISDMPIMIDLAQKFAEHLDHLSPSQEINIAELFTHLITAATGRIFAADHREIDPVLYRLGQYPGRFSL